MNDMREQIADAMSRHINVDAGIFNPCVYDAILAEFANPSREFTDAFLNAWVIGGFPSHASEIHNNYLRKQFSEAMAKAVEAIKATPDEAA